MNNNIKYIIAWLAVWTIWISSAAITWPAAPSGEPTSGLFNTYITKMLVDSNIATTDGKVKKAQDADTLWSGTVIVNAGNVWVWIASPSAKLDVNGTLETTNLQLTTGAQSGYILVSDTTWNATWQPNNYRLKVRSLDQWNPDGSRHTCVTMEDDTVKCRGYNNEGELWVWNQTTIRSLPSDLYLTGVSHVYNIWRSNYALMKDGTVYSWGYNGYWHLGHWDTTNRYIPTKIATLSNVTELSLGAPYTSDRPFVCAKIGTWATSTAKCWGRNGYGSLWDGTTVNKYVPTDVVWLNNIRYIRWTWRWSGWHACALKNDGTVWCWGYNAYWQIWDGSAVSKSVPTQVTWLTWVRDLYVTDGRACAVLTDNVSLRCWGYNNYNQLCDGTATQRQSPVAITTGGATIKSVEMSDYDYFSTYVLFNDGTVKSCGYNGYGQLWTGNTTQLAWLTAISWLTGVTKIKTKWTGSYATTCALLSTGKIKCWWYNGYGQVWNGNTTNVYSPQDVLGIDNAVDIFAAGHSNIYRFYALLSDGSIKAWGNNDNGQLGQWNTLWYSIPVSVKNLNTD